MYHMISQPELDVRNTSKIRNIEYIINIIGKFLVDNKNKLECKLNYEITDLVILLLKNNNYRMKTIETNINTINSNSSIKKNTGIGYGVSNNTTWDVNAYLNNLTRIKDTNIELLNKIITFLNTNKENKDLNEIHQRFNLNTFWIDLIEKYEITEDKYYNSIKDILQIVKYLGLKFNIPFFDQFKNSNKLNSDTLTKEIINYINDIEQKETLESSDSNEYVKSLEQLQMGDYMYVLKQKHYFEKELKQCH